MATIQIETQKGLKSPPDFAFPPKYNFSSPTISEVIATSSTQSPCSPPNFGFPLYPTPPARNPSPRPTELPEIMTPITPLDQTLVDSPALNDSELVPSNKLNLLTVPLEVRLQIYRYVLISHPIHHAHLSPTLNDSSKTDEFHTSLLKPNGLNFPRSSQIQLLTNTSSDRSSPLDDSSTTSSSRIRHTRPMHIQGKIPTPLLRSCKQIYAETHQLPFQTSYFTFVNWFWSGVYAARQFSRSLRPWQSSSLRFTSVEVLGRDLWVGGMARLGGGIGGGVTSTGGYGGKEGKGVGEFRELCGLWDGVWGLRLGIRGSVVIDRKVADVDQAGWNDESGKWSAGGERQDEASVERKKHKRRGILDVQMEWVIDGLLWMKGLRWIELEIEDEDVDRDVKIEFCAELEDVLTELRNRDDGWMGDVKVFFVEQITEVEEGSDGKWYAGEPSDDEDWADGL